MARRGRAAVLCGLSALGASVGFAADRTWTGAGGDGLWATAANWDGGVPVAGDIALFGAAGGAVSVAADTTVAAVRVSGSSAVTLNIADDKTLFVSNAGGGGLDARTADLTINGPGFLKFSTAGGGNDLDNGVNAGHQLVLNAKITGGDFGFEGWRGAADIPGGTIVMGNPANDFTGWVQINGGHTVVAAALAGVGLPSSCGAGDRIRFAYLGTLRYIGAGGGTDRALYLNGGAVPRIGGRLEHAGTGPLVFSGPVLNVVNAAQALVLLGDSASEARITGSIYNSMGTLAIQKEGVGTWVLAGSNTFSGGLTVSAGTLGLDTTNAFGTGTITLDGGTLAINPSAADGFTATLPPVTVSGIAALSIAPGATASTVTFSGITAFGTLAITAPGAGTAANRIFVAGMPSGVVGPWLTLNGGFAGYDPATGLVPASVGQTTLATKGSVLPNGEDIEAVIDTVGTGADIALPADPTRLYSLTQAVAGDDATVALAGKTLYAGELAIASGAAALTVGAAPQDGTLLPLVANVSGPVIPDNSAIVALNPVIWYDPSDAASVRLSVGAVTGLVNKGTGGAALDAAVVRSNFTAPFYAAGADSHAALPMLKLAATSQGLESRANCGISGAAERTLIAVMSHDTGKQCIVSIGAAASGKAFEPYLQAGLTRFGTYSGDIDVTPAVPDATPAVLTFLNGVGGDTGTFQGFVDGVATSTRSRTDLDTTATPLHLGHRNGGGSDTYRGQIGEVLLFDRTLTDIERAAVESYLMAKWKQPKPAGGSTANTTILILRNAGEAPLTVNAAVTEPFGNTVALGKTGAGDAALAGGVTLSGLVRIDGGTLAVNTPAGVEDTLGGSVSGAGALVKGGDGLLRLPYTVANAYAGGTFITGGVLRVGNTVSLGTGDVVISGGGTLDFGDNPDASAVALANRITVSGAGFAGKGALVNNSGVNQINAITRTAVTLAGDASFGGSTAVRWDFRSQSLLDLAGHTLTKTGPADLRFSGGVISNAPVGTAISLQQGSLGLEAANTFEPNTADRVMAIASGARFGLYNSTVPFNWTIQPDAGAILWTYGLDTATNKNVLTSDMTLSGALHLTADGSYGKNLTGLLSGQGGLSVYGGGLLAVSLLSHPANTFSGQVAVSNAVLGLRVPGSLPNLGNVTLAPSGAGVRVYLPGWTGDDVEALAESGLFTANTRLQLEVGAGESCSIPNAIGAPFLGQLDKLGAGAVAFDGNVTMNANARTYAGTLVLTNAATFDLGNYGLYLGDGTGADTALLVGGNAQLVAADRGQGVNQTGIRVAPHPCKAVVEVKDNAFVQGKLLIGGSDSLADTNAVGAVYQSGNSRWAFPAGNSNDGMVGQYGYGYYGLGGGELAIKGGTQFGVMRNSPKSIGIFHQTGGRLDFTTAYGGTFALSRGGVGIAQFEGGTAVIQGQLELLDDYNNNGEGAANVAGGTAVATVADDADITVGAEVLFGNRTNATAVLNLNGGKLTATHLRRLNKAAVCAVNFNGGTLCVTNNAGSTKLISADNVAIQLDARVYGGGAVVELGAGVTRTVDVPLAAAAGTGVASIPVTAGGSGYIAPPFVAITGGGGSGATAFARIDRATGALTAIDVTCPGTGYTSAPTVTLIGGGGTGAALGAAPLALNGDGGLTKTGPGTLLLNAANAYRGPTRAQGGILRLGRADAIAPDSDLVIGDGTLDLGGFTVTNRSVSVTGTGGIVNGKIVTASAVKTGGGAAVLGAGLELAAVSVPPIPGLYEGRVGGAFNKTDPNPRTAIELTTTAANGVSVTGNPVILNGKQWFNESTYIYTGYIWNRGDSDVTWTFAKAFDDSLQLKIDGAAVIDHTGYNTPVKANCTLTPGPHVFEARFGQGSGGVGGTVAGWWTPAVRGLSVDKQGRNAEIPANYEVLADPGDGSLFTVNLTETAPDTVVRVAEGTLRLPPAAPGLYEGRLAGARNLTDLNPCTAVTLGTDQANSRFDFATGLAWPINVTECYSGYIWNREKHDVAWTLYKNFDDTIDLYIDGILVPIDHNSWDWIGMMNVTLTPGAHNLEIRFGQGTGGAGPSTAAANNNPGGWPDTVALGIDFQGRGELNQDYFVKLEDPGDGSLLTLDIGGVTDALSGVTVEVSEGATLDMGGVPHNGLTIIGDGAVIDSAGGTGTVFSPVGDGRTGSLAVSGGSLAGATYRLTIHDLGENAPGLWEGMIPAAWDIATPNPKTAVQLTTRAGNGSVTNNGIYAAGLWAGNFHTWVYTGTLWNDSPVSQVWTWRFTFDDNVALWLDGELVGNIGLAQGIQYRDWSLTPGPHAIEVRYGDGTGNVGPNIGITQGGVGGLAYDPRGRGPASAQANFILLADPGDGSLLSLTADNGANDLITSDGALDLTGLTVVPSDALSEKPLGREYVIIRAEGGLTGMPTLIGFTDKKWKFRKNGNDLLLTTQGGTMMLLK